MPHLPLIDNCFGCAACIDSCSLGAIQLCEDLNGFYKPIIDVTRCVDCGLCEQNCPSLHVNTIIRHRLTDEQLFAAWSTDNEIIQRSASGGVFGQIAKEFLERGNSIVYGAKLTSDSKVVHICIERVEDLHWLQNSKYQQSNTSGIYQDVKTNLKAGKNVIFSGTPCQVAGLYCFLKDKEYPNLYTAEVVCHGVPTNYLATLALKVENAQQIIQYRTKSQGWVRGNRTVYKKTDGTQEECPRYRLDFHFRAYLSFDWLRKSCNHCPFAQINRIADITMGDFWGTKKHINSQGVSLLMVNSKRGMELVRQTKEMILKKTNWGEIAPNQNCYMPTVQGSRFAHIVQYIKPLPLRIQKIIFQHGFSNKWLFGLGQVVEKIVKYPQEIMLRQKKQRLMSQILTNVQSSKQHVGILTTYFATNFGAMLQPYALKRVLEELGYDVELIRYKQQHIYDSHLPISRQILRGHSWLQKISILFALPWSLLQYRKMQRFCQRYLQPNKYFAAKIPENKDYYFFGSDQIWNPKNTNGFDDVYFGNFAVKSGAKKIAYAASGEKIDYTEEQCAYLSKNLLNFDAISVRECTLKQQLEQHIGINNIEVVLDPTLLASKDILDELPKTNPLPNKKYILFYHLRGTQKYLNKIYQFAQSRHLHLLIISSTPKKDLLMYSLRHKNVHYKAAAGMDVFLGSMQECEYVVTASFHGNVFAIVNHKPLFSLMVGDGLDTRTHDLLCKLGMSNRIVTIDTNWSSVEATDYAQIELELQSLREQSMQFIKNNVI